MAELAPDTLALSLERLDVAGRTVRLETGTPLTFRLSFRSGFSVELVSWCCEADVRPPAGTEDRDWWLCHSCEDYLFFAPEFHPLCPVTDDTAERLRAYLTRVAELYFDPLVAVLYASQLEEAVGDFFSALR